MLANEQVRVYRSRIVAGARTFRYCVARSGRDRKLGEYVPDSGGGVRLIVLAGRFVAYDYLLCTPGACSGSTKVLDIRTSRARRFTAQSDSESPALGLNAASSLIVTAAGSVAWIRARPAPNGSAIVNDVFTAAPGGPARVLESGEAIDGDSLAAGGTRLYWTSSGVARSAPIR